MHNCITNNKKVKEAIVDDRCFGNVACFVAQLRHFARSH